ncbi:tRNA(i6A37) synthase [Campylobacter iguaniorum]|uniref:tRNA dimethylallyltransferase n=1 Tax=Campylobacter iguaniorum TaxID=1244531 RepID=A0A076F747_9BACT|nr:tRNA (adenosine(37)-N6)-dimethylallyltransferase MiaA [Campylobacter iguaniorum]AII14100.1 tRNA(i6A37) synthase [Campylobacter iguaniorum]ALV23839.1 tRNA(i6A37) synthase [Campylobacter iguaniorum]
MFYEFGLIGTTASGKSALAIKLASRLGGVILSLDSLCLYKEIDIASAKPNADELSQIRHFGINLVYPDEHFCVGDFIKEYFKAREFAMSNDIPLIITGGSGFYLSAMLGGLSPKLDDSPNSLSNSQIWELVLQNDPEFAAKFSQNDTFRMQKWYQIYTQTSQIPSLWLKQNTTEPIIKNLKIFDIVWDKDELRSRIAQRTKAMLESGLIDEAKGLFAKYPNDVKALNCIGLKESKEFLNGELGDIDPSLNSLNLNDKKSSYYKLFELISTHTAQLAKRQRTFNASKFKDKINVSFESGFEQILANL